MVDSIVKELRVRRPQQFDKLMEDLKAKGIFEKYTSILVFAACLGYRRNNFKEFNAASEPVRLPLFNGQFDESIINLLAILHKGNDPYMMAKENEEEKVRIFEAYACGGLEILSREIFENGHEWDECLSLLILNEYDDIDDTSILEEELSNLVDS